MNTQASQKPTVRLGVERLTELRGADLHDLCDAADAAILDGGGFGWLQPPARQVMESYWRGVLLVPERGLFAARIDGVICGSAQLLRPARNQESRAFAAQLQHAFIAPWARGHGLARQLTELVEASARDEGFAVLNLDVRETQTAAIALYESLGYQRWGVHPNYALVGGKIIAGHYYTKRLIEDPTQSRRGGAR
ncbi:MAG: N-acetyltransferase family protein [Alphaproteobacteria bacterium]